MEYKHSELTQKVIAAAMAVHSELGNGFVEYVYQRSLAIELEQMMVSFQRVVEMPIFYKNIQVGSRRVDFLIDKQVCIELKAIAVLDNVHLSQALNYLEAFNLEVGLLINFGSGSLEVKRLYNKKYKPVNA